MGTTFLDFNVQSLVTWSNEKTKVLHFERVRTTYNPLYHLTSLAFRHNVYEQNLLYVDVS